MSLPAAPAGAPAALWVCDSGGYLTFGADAPAPAHEHLLRSCFRALVTFVGMIAAGLVLGLGVLVAGPYALDGRAFTVMSGSMQPTLGVGDLVVDERIAPLDAHVGDIVTFTDPHGTGRLYTHRVRKITAREGLAHFVTKGDANNDVERWAVKTSGSLGRVRYRIPHVGYVLFSMRTLWGRIVLVILPLVLIGALTLHRIWR